MPYRVAMVTAVTMRPWAQCQGCVWAVPKGLETRNLARDHVRETGHRVVVVVEERTLYGPRS